MPKQVTFASGKCRIDPLVGSCGFAFGKRPVELSDYQTGTGRLSLRPVVVFRFICGLFFVFEKHDLRFADLAATYSPVP